MSTATGEKRTPARIIKNVNEFFIVFLIAGYKTLCTAWNLVLKAL